MRSLFFLVFGCLLQLVLQGQSSANFTSTLNIQPVMELSLTNTASNATFSTPDQYAGEYVISNFNNIKINSNQNWNLSMAATSNVFTASGTFASANMPASICRIGVTGQSAVLTLSTTSQLLSTGNRGSETAAGNSFDITLRINPGYNYGAGIYNIGIVYTLTAK
ncbi:MAG: hypothetical protein INR73_17125 [Williamsia sp.]|nr:hypothetical protein [Williamsia sp.]